jgi:SanA protein
MKRAALVFGQSRVVVVSQKFHVQRALFLADSAGLDAVGFIAADAPTRWWLRARLREVLARDAALVDVALGRGPRYLGQAEIVSLAP